MTKQTKQPEGMIITILAILILGYLTNKALNIWSWTKSQDILFNQNIQCKGTEHTKHEYLTVINCKSNEN